MVGKITVSGYEELGFTLVDVPRLPPEQRVKFILAEISE